MLKIILFIVLTSLIGSIIYYTNSNPTMYTSPISDTKDLKKAYFAGGCFWCMEGIFEAQDGVVSAIS